MASQRNCSCIVQTCVPKYRVPVFAEVSKLEKGGFRVFAGSEYFTEALKTECNSEKWYREVSNVFLLGRRFLLQRLFRSELFTAKVVIFELNPRILSTWVAVFMARVSGVRILFWGHVEGRGERGAVLVAIRRYLLSLARGMVCYTARDATTLRREGYREPVWVPMNSCVSRHQARLGRSERTNALYVGRLIEDKKVDLLIRSIVPLLKKGSLTRLEIAGGGPELERLKSLAVSCEVTDQVIFHGPVFDSSLLAQMHDRAVFTASPGYIGLSAIQSLAYGVPVVIAREEPHAPEIEVCEEDENCVFFKSDDQVDFSRAVESLLQRPEHWDARRSGMVEKVKANYSYEAMAEEFSRVFSGKPSIHAEVELLRVGDVVL
ncbi:glycosyltransferase [Pelagicoccus sp. SDUM812002]|uniref:glycosyltransferase family 4 protein n=1 Tax=Pelagicoccus sp. SDUM812002 TaxID=3041266 RepID=UPI00280E995F|nr:glycosyltransferase [Pelagicoccus sp. SDUM812002]MDQ8188172.1 glycosyltransferase [Pelagicoccus sp. SDUM812002]